ncbi:hypothetical protein MMC30_000309 [Trapelia coarctata]|nr:hypothetical protein [Trapelia coarctata]
MNPQELLKQRQSLTEELYQSPYNGCLYLSRADCYEKLGFPDLAAGDAYKALLLTDEANDESGEYHEQASAAVSEREGEQNSAEAILDDLAWESYACLARNLRKCGCYRSAFDFCERGLSLRPGNHILSQEKGLLLELHQKEDESPFDPNSLLDQGSARRELYVWNTHEPDRFSTESLSMLNTQLATIAPKCEVLAIELPLLTENGVPTPGETTVKQLGLFAKEDILPGETVLHERSVLTANNRLHDPLCDACSAELPPISSDQPLFTCSDCDDTVFCSPQCFDTACTTYHPALCGKDIDAIGKDTPPKEAANALYLLLLTRAIALAETQSIHPLSLPETKYIWGDFIHPDSAYLHSRTSLPFATARHLPFSFTYNILHPLHILEKMDIDIYASLGKYDFWILNTLYAKFRATASARLSTRDGRPEVCAVHPMWCLANHRCAPNVRWEWGGEISFWARGGGEVVRWGPEAGRGKEEGVGRNEEEGVGGRNEESGVCERREESEADGRWNGGIKKGEEVLNHYCDPDLDVKQRREWAAGALGGMCTCERCVWEAGKLSEQVDGKGLDGLEG